MEMKLTADMNLEISRLLTLPNKWDLFQETIDDGTPMILTSNSILLPPRVANLGPNLEARISPKDLENTTICDLGAAPRRFFAPRDLSKRFGASGLGGFCPTYSLHNSRLF